VKKLRIFRIPIYNSS